MKITYLVSTYNRKDKILNLINNFVLQKKLFNLIIIDHNSSDGTFEELSKINDKRIKLIRYEENHGCIIWLYLAKKVKTEIFTWLSDEDIVNLNNEKYLINLFLSQKNIDVVLGEVIYGEDWFRIFFGRNLGLQSNFNKKMILLNFSGISGIYIRTSSFKKSKILKNINISSSYNFCNYYPIGMIALESCFNSLYLSDKIFAVQACFAQTTNAIIADKQRPQLSEPHYFPMTMVDRFYSRSN